MGEQLLTDAQRNSTPLLQALRQLFPGAAAEKYSAILEDEGFETLHDVSFATVELLEGVGFTAADANSLWETATTGKINIKVPAAVQPVRSEPVPSAEAVAAGRGGATDTTSRAASSSSSSRTPAVPVVLKAGGGGRATGAGAGEAAAGGPAEPGPAEPGPGGGAAAAVATDSDTPITHREMASLLADHISLADAKRPSSQKEDLDRHVRSPRNAPRDPAYVLAPSEHEDPPLATCLGWLRYPGEATRRFCVFDSWRDLVESQTRAKCVVLASQKIGAYRNKARILGAWMVYTKALRHAMLAAQKIKSSDEFFTAAFRNSGKIAIQQQQRKEQEAEAKNDSVKTHEKLSASYFAVKEVPCHDHLASSMEDAPPEALLLAGSALLSNKTSVDGDGRVHIRFQTG